MGVWVDWFNRVWKGPPNEIAAQLDRAEPDRAAIAALAEQMRDWLDVFEAMLAGRPYLMGDELSAADCAAFPFLKYALLEVDPRDEETFHRVLVDHQALGDDHPRLEEWIRRVDAHPRAAGPGG